MRFSLLVILVACTKGASPCPTVAALDKLGTAADHDANVSLHELCVTDHWLPEATECLHAATTRGAVDQCLKKHVPAAETDLSKRPTEDQQEKQASEVLFEDKLATKQPSFGSSPECAAYLQTITSTLKATITCDAIDGLTLFGGQQTVFAQLQKLDLLDETQKPAACKGATAELHAEKALHCTL